MRCPPIRHPFDLRLRRPSLTPGEPRALPLRRLLPLLVCTALLLPAAAAPAAEAPAREWLTSLTAAQAAARKAGAPILVDLYAEWCGWCKVLEERVFSHPDFQRRAADWVLLRVDVEDGGEGTALMERYQASSLPTTLILDADLAEVGRIQGFQPLATFLASVDLKLEAHRLLLADYERVRKGSDLGALAALAQELHRRRDGARAAVVYERLMAVGRAGELDGAGLRYRWADALRLTGSFAQASEALAEARRLAAAQGDRALLEACDLLRVEIAREQGDCSEAVAAAESFLETYPESLHRGTARRTLQDNQACT